jgi:glycosyltransferase involved in cell wall biosynthesis
MRIAMIRLQAAALLDLTSSETFGGAEVRALTFAQGLADRTDHDVKLVVRALPEGLILRRGRLSVQTLCMGRKGVEGGKLSRILWRTPLHSSRRLVRSLHRRVSGQPDVWRELCQVPADVLCSFGLHDPTASVVRTAQLARRRSVVFLTSDEDTQQALAAGAIGDRHRCRHHYAIERADLVVAQTQRQHDWVRQAGRPVVLIRNPIDTSTACPIAPMANRKYVLWVGRADTNCKRADICLQLAAHCPDVPFLMVMNPQDPRAARQLRTCVPSNVKVLPRVAWPQSESLFQDALVLLNTSESEGFPNAFLQAAKFGVPVLSRRVNPDFALTSHGWGWVANDDLSQLSQMILRVAKRPEWLAEASQAARRYVQRYHALDERLSELKAALEGLFHGCALDRQEITRGLGGSRDFVVQGSPD